MKKLLSISIISICLFSCSPIHEKILKEFDQIQVQNIEERYMQGSKVYLSTYDTTFDYVKSVELKNFIDKNLNVLPSKVEEGKYLSFKESIVNIYKWETPHVIIDYSFYFNNEYEVMNLWIEYK